jgi:hypothetical protein
MLTLQWWLNLTPHQLDVVRTIATVFGAAFVPFLSFLLGWGIRLLRITRRDAAQARAQTAHVEYVDGKEHSVSVTEYARHAAHAGDRAVTAGEASRQETSDLAGWLTGTGRRRLPTSELPRQEPSVYE